MRPVQVRAGAQSIQSRGVSPRQADANRPGRHGPAPNIRAPALQLYVRGNEASSSANRRIPSAVETRGW
jgi:hypothetical protein